MLSSKDLLELHERTQRGFVAQLKHCRRLSADELHRPFADFGEATVQRYLHHLISCEDYWINGVLRGEKFPDDRHEDYLTVKQLEEYNAEVAARTADYLARTSTAKLNAPAEFTVWKRRKRTLIPAMVVMRVITHSFHHRGQVATLCRIIGHPSGPLDFPIRP